MPSFKFHFKEIDWVIYVPSHGNEKRSYDKFGVAFRDRRRGVSQPGRKTSLKEVLNKKDVSKKYPHTVGFFLSSSGKGSKWKPDYLRTKKIKKKKEFYDYLKEFGL